MALEELITKLIASLDANTAAMKGGAAPASTKAGVTTPASTTKTTAKTPAGPTFDEVKALAAKVMEQKSRPFAKKIIADVGGAKELATVKPDKYPALVKALNAALVEEEAPEEEASEEDTEL